MTTLILILAILVGSTSFSMAQTEIPKDSLEYDFTVVIFLGLECPVSQKYITKLNTIYSTHKDKQEIEWLFVIPEVVKKRQIKKFSKQYKVQFALKSDESNQRITLAYGATATPEAFIEKDGKILYRGAIDNWFYELGRYRQVITKNYLIDALESVLRNQEPLIKETTPIGCFIQQSSSAIHDHEK